ncbi:MAG: peptide ABC transporter substrate-binding protein [Rhodospirillaceae bacterium]|nr:peptide ABC transporter substrate-binding protein [Rhodospirillaceae bacterium]
MRATFRHVKRATLALALALATGAGTAAAEQVLHRGNGAEPETLDPHKSTGVTENNIENDLFEGLVAWSADGKVTPAIAESWDVSDDGKVYTFHLRDAKWSNGDPLTAEDFVYSFRRAVDPATASDYAPILAPIVNASEAIAGKVKPDQIGVEAVDAKTLKITLNAPTPYLTGLLCHNIGMPVHRATVEKFGDQWTRPGNEVGDGAYVISEWVPQDHITLVKNPNYWDAANVKLDKVVYYPTEDIEEELKRYRAGELDITYEVPSGQVKWLLENMKDEFHNEPYLGTYYYVINLTKAPLGKDKRIREALSMAVDRETLVDKITQAGELPAYAWVPPNLEGYEQQQAAFKDWPMDKRIAEARKLLAEAGYGPDKPLKIELLYNTSENHKKIAVAIASMWKKALGVEVTLRNEEWKVYLDTRDKKNFEIARAAWIGDFPDPVNFLDMFLSDAGQRNDAGYDNPKFDELMHQAAATADAAARMKLLEQAERLFIDDVAMIPIYHYTTHHMVKPKVKGWAFNILDIHRDKYLSLAE